jgi:hypothetical protein
MFWSYFTLACLAHISFGAPSGATVTPLVNLGYSTYEGFVHPNSNNTHFIGMRYAAPPTGELHLILFRPP